jgi:hypothetical protein
MGSNQIVLSLDLKSTTLGRTAFYLKRCFDTRFPTKEILRLVIAKNQNAVQLQAVDHSARRSMKNVASYVKRCELQDTPST